MASNPTAAAIQPGHPDRSRERPLYQSIVKLRGPTIALNAATAGDAIEAVLITSSAADGNDIHRGGGDARLWRDVTKTMAARLAVSVQAKTAGSGQPIRAEWAARFWKISTCRARPGPMTNEESGGLACSSGRVRY